MPTGTHDISSLLSIASSTAVEFGLDRLNAVLQADLDAHNAAVTEAVQDMAELTTEREAPSGTSDDGEMQEVDEYGRAPTQKAEVGARVAWPLRLFQFNLGWTAKYLQVTTPQKLAQQQLHAEAAHWRAILREIKRAIYGSANYDFRDHLVDNLVLGIKRFVNADGDGIPNGPNGEAFDGDTHTHYDANNGWLASALLAAINDVIEHGHGAAVTVAINVADETAVRALSGFVPYPDPRIIYRATDTPGQTLDISRLDNRAIGVFGGAEIWTKSWALDNYPFIWDAGDPRKPLRFRQRNQSTLQGLRLAAENADYPLYVKFQEAEFGVGVNTRTNGAVLYVGGGSYVNPTIS
jgi:hypothetical protein